MSRRVGFGGEDTSETGRTSGAGQRVLQGPIKWILSIFLAGWLTGWAAAMIMVVETLLSDLGQLSAGATAFMLIFLIAGGIGWWFVARTLARILRDQPIVRGVKRNTVKPSTLPGLNDRDML